MKSKDYFLNLKLFNLGSSEGPTQWELIALPLRWPLHCTGPQIIRMKTAFGLSDRFASFIHL